ncbi:hypothetical protein D3C80_1861030 [compost metagenome]
MGPDTLTRKVVSRFSPREIRRSQVSSGASVNLGKSSSPVLLSSRSKVAEVGSKSPNGATASNCSTCR